MKNLIKDLIFIIIFLFLLNICTNILVLKGNTYGSDVISFYNQKKNSLDIVFFGSSHSYATFSPDIIEKETGLKSYNFATQQQPIYITYHYMLETLKTQKPKYFVLETKMLAVDDEFATEGVIRDAVDKMRTSINKINTINVSVKEKEERISYYFNIIKYHTRYNKLTKTDIKTGLTQKGIDNKGFKNLESNNDITINNEKILEITEKEQISNKNLKYLNKIIKLVNENNIELILVKSPCQLTEQDQKKYNWIEDYAKENEIYYVNYNTQTEQLNLKSGDYYDMGHLSYEGAKKVTLDFLKYLE